MTRGHGLTAIDGAIALIAILLVVQMWLLTATLEAYLAGHSEPIIPAAEPVIPAAAFAATGRNPISIQSGFGAAIRNG